MLVTPPLNNVKAYKFYILKNKVVQVVQVVVKYNPVVVEIENNLDNFFFLLAATAVYFDDN